MHKKVDVLVIALSSPIQIGIYVNNTLLETIASEKKSSDILPFLFKDILQRYELEKLFYVKGPGSFMAIKVSYIFLHLFFQNILRFLSPIHTQYNNK